MIGGCISLICALLLWLIAPEGYDISKLRPIFVLGGSMFLLFSLAAMLYIPRSLQKNQYKTIGLGLGLFIKDWVLITSLSLLFAFFLFSIALVLFPPNGWLLALWIVGLGGSFDLARFYVRRSYKYISIPFLLKKIEKKLDKSLRDEDETKALNILSVVIEACSLSIMNHRPYVATMMLEAVQRLTEVYVKELARIELLSPPSLETEGKPSFLDKVNYLCMYVCERLQWMHENAIRSHMRPTAIEIITTFGKLSLFFSRQNPDLAALPITFLLKCTHEAQNQGDHELVVRSSFALCETCKAFIQQAQARNESFKGLIIDCISSMEEVAKMMYQHNKGINPALLMQPFAEIGQFLGTERMQKCPDRDEILNELRRSLIQFQSLEIVMGASEEMTQPIQDTSSSFTQDIPFTP